jgi:hypothetical protein
MVAQIYLTSQRFNVFRGDLPDTVHSAPRSCMGKGTFYFAAYSAS